MDHECVIVLDFGGQYNQLIARRIREEKVYCEILPYDTPLEKIWAKKPKGIIFTGGPSVVTEKDAPMVDKKIFEAGVPVLGICYGAQLMGHLMGAPVEKAANKEYGKTEISFVKHPLFEGIPETDTCWMSHTYHLASPPEGFQVIASTKPCAVAAIANDDQKLYGVQFHPEVEHTPNGQKILHNFLYAVCGCSGDWKMKDFVLKTIEDIKTQVGDGKVLCALSGGVDSSVAAVLVHRAIGKNLTCIFVDHGLMRKDEGDEVESIFSKQFDMNLIRVNAEERFLSKLAGVVEPEQKRKIIGEEFIRVFEDEGKKIGSVDFLCQGTIYPDIVESGSKNAAVIKSHHNVGGLPDVIEFKGLVEPLKELFKDEVREVGLELGIPEFLVMRQPFPGPGLAVRVIGDITKDKLDLLREADFIFREEIAGASLDRAIWQYFAVLTNLKSVGVMGDERTYNYTVALRAVHSSDAMTADWAKIPYEVLERVSSRIVNEVPGVNRIVYDITTKPPSTIEWE